MRKQPLYDVVEALRQDLQVAREHPDVICGLPTGLHRLDRQLGGLQDNELIVVGARPGQGKTALAWQWATSAARYALEQDRSGFACFACGEMPANELIRREVARLAGISVLRQKQGDFNDEEDLLIQGALDEISLLPLAIYDRTGLDLSKIESWIEGQPGGCYLAVIDYLQLVQPSGNESRYQAVSSAINRLRSFRDHLQAPLVVLSQLRRPEAGQELERPSMSALRDAGAIEEAANVVMLLHNTAVVPSVPRDETVTELMVEKNRQGWTGIIPLDFIAEEVRFADVDAHAERARAAVEESLAHLGQERQAVAVGA